MAGTPRPTKRDVVAIVGYAITLMALYAVLQLLSPEHAVAVTIIAAGAALMAIMLASHHKVIATQHALYHAAATSRRQDFHHIEALLSLIQTLQPVAPLTTTRGWAAAPDFLKLVAETVLRKQPQLVVEASSGTSTLVIAYCLKRLGGGKVIALEHEAEYAEQTRRAIALHGLEAYADVVHTPLVNTPLNGSAWQWYDVSGVYLKRPVDLMVVDGPPGTTQKDARYPALPVFKERLAPDAVLLLDDARRPDEQAFVQRWVTEFPGSRADFVELEKGAFVVALGT